VRDNLLDVLLQDLEEQLGRQCGVKFVVRERAPGEDVAEAPVVPESTSQVTSPPPSEPPPSSRQLQINLKYTFDSFVVGPSNQFAVAACTAVANSPGKAYNPLFLYGGVGWQDALVHAVGNHALRQNPNCHVVYLSSESFTNDLIHALEQHGCRSSGPATVRKCDILLLDDIQFLSNKKRRWRVLPHLQRAARSRQADLRHLRQAAQRDRRVSRSGCASRFQWGLIADIQPPEVETRWRSSRRRPRPTTSPCPTTSPSSSARTSAATSAS